MASELVSNAVRHSDCVEDQMLNVTVRHVDDHIEISVWDPRASGARAELSDRAIAAGGLGLKIVDQLSARWGSERSTYGYRVWAELALAA